MKIIQTHVVLFLCTLPVLGFGQQDVASHIYSGPYDTLSLQAFLDDIQGKKLNKDLCSYAPLESRIFEEGSCGFRRLWENPKNKRSYYTIAGKPRYEILASGWVEDDPAVTSNATMSDRENGVPYEDRIAFLIETSKAGKVLDSSFYILYDPTDFGERNIKPVYSNFGNLWSYLISVKAYSTNKGFEDVLDLVKDGGMEIYKQTETQISFTPPLNPYDLGSRGGSLEDSIEGRSRLLADPNWPEYGRITLLNGTLKFEISGNGNDGTWKSVY